MGSALQLLADAETGEDPSQQIIRTHLPGDLAQRVMRQPQLFGGQFRCSCASSPSARCACSCARSIASTCRVRAENSPSACSPAPAEAIKRRRACRSSRPAPVAAETNTRSGRQHRQRIQQVRLVVDVDLVRHRCHGLAQRRFAGRRIARIQHDQRQVGALDFHMCAAHAFAFDGVAAVARPAVSTRVSSSRPGGWSREACRGWCRRCR